MKVFYLLNTKLGKEYEVMDRLKGYKETSEVFLAYGVFDAFLIANLEDRESMLDFRRKLSRTESITSIISMVEVKA